ncbi:MAG: arylamine N-acetyltransferase [Bacteroidetes bacterium]|nr:arylamine N-acetyltransferase [Bacteroidota bacterium]
MEIKKYLSRIGINSQQNPNLQTLIALHKSHILNVPFENLDIHLGREIILDFEKFYTKIVINNRGGFCYELNGSFFSLLTNLGYNGKMISARVANSKGDFGKEFDHMAIIVKLDDEWLVDVGFGDSFIEPLKIELELTQKQYGRTYKIIKHDEDYFKLMRSLDGNKFEDQYIFTLKERALNDFNEMCIYNQTSPQTSFTQKRICTMATEDGRVTLSDLKLIINKDGVKTETQLKDEEEFNLNLRKYFKIYL